jgi:CHASE1-domain containing sensor protein
MKILLVAFIESGPVTALLIGFGLFVVVGIAIILTYQYRKRRRREARSFWGYFDD